MASSSTGEASPVFSAESLLKYKCNFSQSLGKVPSYRFRLFMVLSRRCLDHPQSDMLTTSARAVDQPAYRRQL
jgi:hypothetical protein